jgi:catechol 2,3-dioxygenase-like lactoylglutathione lyase family enzyme
MLDHLTLTVADLERSIAFYTRALEPLGYGLTMRLEGFVGFGTKRKPFFWIKSGPTPTQSMHIAFVAPSRADVDRFHQAALAAGARDNGPPGLRPDYHPHYYGAFVIDPDLHNLEAVSHFPPPTRPGPPPRKRTEPKRRATKRPAPKRRATRRPAPKRRATRRRTR